MTKKTQVAVFVSVLAVLFALAVVGLVAVYGALLPVLGSVGTVALTVIAGWALGALLGYTFLRMGVWLAERGWFV